MRILIVDDNHSDNDNLKVSFPGDRVVQAFNFTDAIAKLEELPDVIVLDAFFPVNDNAEPIFMAENFLSGLEKIVERRSVAAPEIILVSGQGDATRHFDDIEEWLNSRRIGAVSAKGLANAGWPFFQAVLRRTANDLLEMRNLRSKYKDLDDECRSLSALGISTCDPAMTRILQRILRAARVSLPVLILGERGTGKDLVARAIHQAGGSGPDNVDERPFKVVPVGASRVLPEDSFFGHERGSFTGAINKHIGFFEAAKGGTIFIDEIGDVPLEIQATLLRVIQESEITRVGSSDSIKINTRVIAATNKDIYQMTLRGEFRSDLYDRLKALVIKLPALRERPKDILFLADIFLDRFNKDHQKNVTLTHDLRRAIDSGQWLGNVRELEGFIESLVVNYDGQTSLKDICESYRQDARLDELQRMLDVEPATFSAAAAPVVTDVSQLYLEIKFPPATTWKGLGENEKEDSRNETLVFSLLQESVKKEALALLDNLKTLIESRTSADGKPANSPRRIHHYLALLYLVLSDKHKASINDFKTVLAVDSWDYLNRIGRTLTEIWGDQFECLVSLQPREESSSTSGPQETSETPVKPRGGRNSRTVFYLNQAILVGHDKAPAGFAQESNQSAERAEYDSQGDAQSASPLATNSTSR